jgi:6,7-dimethyl-8-ribityllumazine synthase
VRIGIVVARFNDFVTERLLGGARQGLADAGVSGGDIEVHWVPGAFEIPLAAEALAASGRVAGVICLGCLIKGATPHFEYISSACAHGIMAAQSKTRVPMAFGVLTTNSVEEALERAVTGPGNKGREAADAVLEMARLLAGPIGVGP